MSLLITHGGATLLTVERNATTRAVSARGPNGPGSVYTMEALWDRIPELLETALRHVAERPLTRRQLVHARDAATVQVLLGTVYGEYAMDTLRHHLERVFAGPEQAMSDSEYSSTDDDDYGDNDSIHGATFDIHEITDIHETFDTHSQGTIDQRRVTFAEDVATIEAEPPRCCCICLVEKPTVFADCGDADHGMCSSCFVRFATNWPSHIVSPNHPFFGCPGEGCPGRYDMAQARGMLRPLDFKRLVDLCAEAERAQTTLVPCSCGAHFAVHRDRLQNRTPGSVMLRCSDCARWCCYHCLATPSAAHVLSVVEAYDMIAGPLPTHSSLQDELIRNDKPCRTKWLEKLFSNDAVWCHCCANGLKTCGSFNQYVVPLAPRKSPQAALLRNFEITVETVKANVLRIVTDASAAVCCTKCLLPLHRSTHCHELTHCGVKKCDVCGKSALEFDDVIFDHWDSDGLEHKCPRWPTDSFWTDHVICADRCQEGHCHDDHHDCTDPRHENFRSQVREVRRLRQLDRLLISLPTKMQSFAIHVLQNHEVGRNYWTTLQMAADLNVAI